MTNKIDTELDYATSLIPSDVEHLLIDADTLVYSCGFACERKKHTLVDYGCKSFQEDYGKEGKEFLLSLIPEEERDTGRFALITEDHIEPVSHALQMVKSTVRAIQDVLMVDSTTMYLSGKTNFRDDLATILPYKGNRAEARQPVHKQEILDYIKTHFPTIVSDGIEADDAMGLDQRDIETCIVSIDKDMLTVPGWHYNWKTRHLSFVSSWEALVNFYTQLLTGDPVDNIPGIRGIGPKKAAKLLSGCMSETQLWETVQRAYKEMSDYTPQQVHEIGQLLWIQRKGRTSWQPPEKTPSGQAPEETPSG